MYRNQNHSPNKLKEKKRSLSKMHHLGEEEGSSQPQLYIDEKSGTLKLSGTNTMTTNHVVNRVTTQPLDSELLIISVSGEAPE